MHAHSKVYIVKYLRLESSEGSTLPVFLKKWLVTSAIFFDFLPSQFSWFVMISADFFAVFKVFQLILINKMATLALISEYKSSSTRVSRGVVAKREKKFLQLRIHGAEISSASASREETKKNKRRNCFLSFKISDANVAMLQMRRTGIFFHYSLQHELRDLHLQGHKGLAHCLKITIKSLTSP